VKTVEELRSHDGTTIAVDKTGNGQAVVLVDGAFGSRQVGPKVATAPLLAEHFTVFHYDRAGAVAVATRRRTTSSVRSRISLPHRRERWSAFVFGAPRVAILPCERRRAAFRSPSLRSGSRTSSSITADRRSQTIIWRT
jgi:hypothetical protein